MTDDEQKYLLLLWWGTLSAAQRSAWCILYAESVQRAYRNG